MRDLLARRSTIFFGGKGGVGKTTCAAAAAVAAASLGRQVLLVSTDPAHSTSDVLGVPLGPDPRHVGPRLEAVEIDPAKEARRYLDEARARIGELFSASVAKQASKQIDAAADTPGLEETATLERLTHLIGARDRYELVIVDTAPTGHTLRLLRLPETMTMWVGALAKARAAVAAEETGVVDPLLTALQARMERLDQLRAELTNSSRTTFVLVLTPERLPIEETARAASELASIGVHVGGIVVNRVLPADAAGAFLDARRAQEARYLGEIAERFARFPRVEIAQQPSDVHGLEALRAIAARLSDQI